LRDAVVETGYRLARCLSRHSACRRVLADAPRGTIQPLLQHLKDGTLRVELEIHHADGVADRLTDGLLGSASLLASAQLLSRGTGPRIGPVSAQGAIALEWEC
jgi:ubiquinone biosynthesis protein